MKNYTEVTITFKVENNMYKDYDGAIDEVLNTLDEVAEDIEIKEG